MTGQFPAEFARRGVVDGFGKRNEVITTYFGGKGVDKGTRERTAGNGVAGSIHHNRCPGLAVRKPSGEWDKADIITFNWSIKARLCPSISRSK